MLRRLTAHEALRVAPTLLVPAVRADHSLTEREGYEVYPVTDAIGGLRPLC